MSRSDAGAPRAPAFEVRVRRFTTPLFRVLFACSPAGVCWVSLADDEEALLAWCRRHEPHAKLVPERALCAPFVDALRSYTRSAELDLRGVKLDLRGTPFQMRVWSEVRRVASGATATYGEIAKRIGRPSACRAVGRANASNPLAIVVPSHRVVGGRDLGGRGLCDGEYGGTLGGLANKRALLELEGVNVSAA
jgi:O-6-methylguanine DNA methyltransferase